jgi:hypothetical protein
MSMELPKTIKNGTVLKMMTIIFLFMQFFSLS